MATDFSRLRRPRISMPTDVQAALRARGLQTAYRQRPAYPTE